MFVFFKISLHFDELTQVDCCQLLISEISSKTSKRCLLGLSICSVLSSCLRRHHHHSSLQFKMEKGKEKNILIIQGGNFVGGCCLCCNPKSMILKECTLKNVSRALSTFTLVDINLCCLKNHNSSSGDRFLCFTSLIFVQISGITHSSPRYFLPQPCPKDPGGIMSKRYCLWSCSACRCSSSI